LAKFLTQKKKGNYKSILLLGNALRSRIFSQSPSILEKEKLQSNYMEKWN